MEKKENVTCNSELVIRNSKMERSRGEGWEHRKWIRMLWSTDCMWNGQPGRNGSAAQDVTAGTGVWIHLGESGGKKKHAMVDKMPGFVIRFCSNWLYNADHVLFRHFYRWQVVDQCHTAAIVEQKIQPTADFAGIAADHRLGICLSSRSQNCHSGKNCLGIFRRRANKNLHSGKKFPSEAGIRPSERLGWFWAWSG